MQLLFGAFIQIIVLFYNSLLLSTPSTFFVLPLLNEVALGARSVENIVFVHQLFVLFNYLFNLAQVAFFRQPFAASSRGCGGAR